MWFDLMPEALVVILAGIWRYIDGRVWGRTAVRNAVGMVVSLVALYIAFGLSWWLLLSLPAMANIVMGYTKWEDMLYNGFRFFVGTFITGLPYIVYTIAIYDIVPIGCLAYMASGWLMGPLFYYLAQYKPSYLPEGLAEFGQGAILIGGLSLIAL